MVLNLLLLKLLPLLPQLPQLPQLPTQLPLCPIHRHLIKLHPLERVPLRRLQLPLRPFLSLRLQLVHVFHNSDRRLHAAPEVVQKDAVSTATNLGFVPHPPRPPRYTCVDPYALL